MFNYYDYSANHEPRSITTIGEQRTALWNKIKTVKEEYSLYSHWSAQGKEMAKKPARKLRKELKKLQAEWERLPRLEKVDGVKEDKYASASMTTAEIMGWGRLSGFTYRDEDEEEEEDDE